MNSKVITSFSPIRGNLRYFTDRSHGKNDASGCLLSTSNGPLNGGRRIPSYHG